MATGLIDIAEALWDDLRGIARDQLRLAALETRRAGVSVVAIAAFGVAAGVLTVTAWLGLTGAIVLWLIDCGVAASAALLLAALLNLLGVFWLAIAIRHKIRQLQFPATVQSLVSNGKAVLVAGRL